MASSKAEAVGYWVLTLLVLLPLAGSGFPELLSHGPAQTVETLHRLGYPLYLMKIIGLAKIAGAITVLLNRPPRMMEWAYAGFFFLLLGAMASHLLARDFAHAAIPFIVFLLLVPSYVLHNKVRPPIQRPPNR